MDINSDHLVFEGHEGTGRSLLLRDQQATGLLNVYVELAKAAMKLKHLGEAEHWWSRGLEVEPYNLECHLGIGAVKFHLGKLTEAIQIYEFVLDIDPEVLSGRISLAIAYLWADCPSQALANAESVLAREPDAVDMRLTKASALVKLGRATDAVADLAWIYRQGDKIEEVALLECEVNCALGDYEVALLIAADLASAYPTLPAPLKCFRSTFDAFLNGATIERVDEFLMGLGLPPPSTNVETDHSENPLTSSPTTDIVIPVHDGLEGLIRCLESVEAHRSPTLGKIVLVNDCSSSGTRTWLRRFAKSRSDVHLIHTRQRSGFTKSVVLGITRSQTERFVVLNSDCIVGEAWLERLGAAMKPKGRVAMVGPMSNSAAWQNLSEIFDTNGNYANHAMPNSAAIERIQKRLDFIKAFDFPNCSLIHGFCVLLDRDIYDRLGGLDADLFPKGYGEFQDLSLRVLDSGYELRIADNCFVAHAQGGSILLQQRIELSERARRILYEKYTALRYLSAECIAATNRQIAFTRRRFEEIEHHCPYEISAEQTAAKLTVFGEVEPHLSGRKVCIFVAFAPTGRLLPYTLRYLAELNKNGFYVVLVVNQIGIHRLQAEVHSLTRTVILRDNIGFDFGAWRDVAARFPSVWKAEILLFANDSVVGPFSGFNRIIERVTESTSPLFFLTESEFSERHFQSYWWGIKGTGLTNPVFRAFFESIKDLTDKTAAVYMYEVFFRHVCEKLGGMTSLCLFPLLTLTVADSDIRQTFNPTHHFWRELLEAGFPFIKVDFCRKNVSGPAARAWEKAIIEFGGNHVLARLHIEAVHAQRLSRQS